VLPVDDWIDLQAADLAAGVRTPTSGRGADIVLDVVGGAIFEKCLPALAWRGRKAAISSSPEPQVSFNPVDFYHNESRLLGVDSLKLSLEETAGLIQRLSQSELSQGPPSAQRFILHKQYGDLGRFYLGHKLPQQRRLIILPPD
jgi:NADPH:quinone reductase